MNPYPLPGRKTIVVPSLFVVLGMTDVVLGTTDRLTMDETESI